MIQAVPKIQRNPRTVSQNAIHYGYLAYQDILTTPQLRVQPDTSPYYHRLPCKELIPFTNIEVSEIDEKQVQNPKRRKGVPPVTNRQKTAFECAREVEVAYADWNFQILHPLTGRTEDEAFRIFQAVQPFAYKLKDILAALDEADERIDSDGPFSATYEGDTVTLKPLSDEERITAREVLAQVRAAANIAVDLATEKLERTIRSMTQARNGGIGKAGSDPLDRKLCTELGVKPPKAVDMEIIKDTPKEETESLELKRREIELRERELELRQKELDLLEKKENREKMAQVRAGKTQPSV